MVRTTSKDIYNSQDEEQVRSLLDRLLELEHELKQEMDSLATSSKPVILDQQAVGRISRGDALQYQHMVKANLQLCEERMEMVKGARDKIEDHHDYGHCECCDKPISLARLMIRPESRLCLSCQAKAEQS